MSALLQPTNAFSYCCPSPQLARKPSAYLAQTWDRASSTLRPRRSITGSSNDLSPGAAAPTGNRTRRKSNLGGGSSGSRKLAPPPLSRAPHVGISVHVGDAPGVLLSVDVDGSPCVSTAASTLYDMPSVRQSLAGTTRPPSCDAATAGATSVPMHLPSPFAAASAAAASNTDGGGNASDVAVSRLGRRGSSDAGGAERKGGASPTPTLALHHRWALWLLGPWT